MKPSTALGIILDLVSNSQLLRRITTQMCVSETLTINLGVFFFFYSTARTENVSIVSWRNAIYEATLNKTRKTREIYGKINSVLWNENIFYHYKRNKSNVPVPRLDELETINVLANPH